MKSKSYEKSLVYFWVANFLNFHLVKSDFQLVFICSLYRHLQYHFRMEEVLKCHENDVIGLRKIGMIVNHRLLSSPMIVNQWHSEMMNQPLVPTLRPSASAPALGVDSSSPRAIDFLNPTYSYQFFL